MKRSYVILLGPQVRFIEGKIKDIVKGKIPVAVIDIFLYGKIDGLGVLEQAYNVIDAF